MKKLKEYQKTIIILALVVIGAIAIIFGKSMAIQFGVAGSCWGVAALILAFITRQKGDRELLQYDEHTREILKDISANGEQSEYFGLVDIASVNKWRNKLYKKINKENVNEIRFIEKRKWNS